MNIDLKTTKLADANINTKLLMYPKKGLNLVNVNLTTTSAMSSTIKLFVYFSIKTVHTPKRAQL